MRKLRYKNEKIQEFLFGKLKLNLLTKKIMIFLYKNIKPNKNTYKIEKHNFSTTKEKMNIVVKELQTHFGIKIKTTDDLVYLKFNENTLSKLLKEQKEIYKWVNFCNSPFSNKYIYKLYLLFKKMKKSKFQMTLNCLKKYLNLPHGYINSNVIFKRKILKKAQKEMADVGIFVKMETYSSKDNHTKKHNIIEFQIKKMPKINISDEWGEKNPRKITKIIV